jgi:hypothetical protein
LQKDHDVAIKFFSRAIQLRPDFAYAHTLCGHEHAAKDDWEQVRESRRGGKKKEMPTTTATASYRTASR